MRILIMAISTVLAGCQSLTAVNFKCEETGNAINPITIKNKAEYPLICQRAAYREDWALSQQFEIGPALSSQVKVCPYEDLLACQIKTSKGMSTFITYFAPLKSGTYNVTLEDVPWEPGEEGRSCGEGNAKIPKDSTPVPKTRSATVVEDPDGKKVYKW